MISYKLHLIRHGITSGNLMGLYQGSGTDLPLCDEGIAQLENLKSKFTYPAVEKLYVSPMKRAVETAEIIYPEMDYTFISDLRECNFGEFEGKTFKELMEADENFARWMDPTSGYQPAGGESSSDFVNRVVSALDEIFTDMMKKGIHEAARVTHGGVISTLMAAVAFPRKSPGEWSSDNGCGFTLATDPQMWTRDGYAQAVEILPLGYDFSQSDFNRYIKKNREE